MAKGTSAVKRKSKVMLYMMAALLLVAGGLLVAGRMLGSEEEALRVKGVVAPEIAQAPDPVKEPVASKPDAKDDEKSEPKDEAPVAEAPIVEEPVVEEPVVEEPVVEEPAVKEGSVSDAPDPGSTAMTLSVPKMGIAGDPIYEGVDDATLMNGAGHAPTTGYPWVPGSNTYVASHVLGYEGTGSYMDFAALPSMAYGDEIVVTDANGTTYTYIVSEILEVDITEVWVMDPTGSDQISLQTCINPPNYDVRLVVRGDLTNVQPA
jgi:sortase A